MKILIDNTELQGTATEILASLSKKKKDWDGEDITLEEFFDYMCQMYYNNTGEKIEIIQDLEIDTKTLFEAMAKEGELEYIEK